MTTIKDGTYEIVVFDYIKNVCGTFANLDEAIRAHSAVTTALRCAGLEYAPKERGNGLRSDYHDRLLNVRGEVIDVAIVETEYGVTRELGTVVYPDKDMTVEEVAKTYGIQSGTIRVTIHKGWLKARKSGKNWLIKRSDASSRWGDKK